MFLILDVWDESIYTPSLSTLRPAYRTHSGRHGSAPKPSTPKARKLLFSAIRNQTVHCIEASLWVTMGGGQSIVTEVSGRSRRLTAWATRLTIAECAEA